jgi:shikimate dehydrogenase
MQVFGLIGNPVGHSLSPPMHEAAYEELGIDARYVTLEPDRGDAAAAVRGADALGVAGLNVTIPFKEAALPVVDPTPAAERIGAVNTVAFGEGEPRGYNTDAVGARRALESAGAELAGETAVVVGAGGAGRAVAVGLADADATVRVANRTVERATAVAADAGEGVSAHGLDDLPELTADASVLVNATSVGMGEDRSPVPSEALHGGLTVLDAVYDPLETRLLREAREAGAAVVDGAEMLLYQGAEAFETWTGEPAPVSAMDGALREHL